MFKTLSLSKIALTTPPPQHWPFRCCRGSRRAGEFTNRFHRQQARINQGVRSGQLTQREYNADERRLQTDEFLRKRDMRRNDGQLTRRQDINLNRRLNRNSRDIYFTKHNRADQPGV